MCVYMCVCVFERNMYTGISWHIYISAHTKLQSFHLDLFVFVNGPFSYRDWHTYCF